MCSVSPLRVSPQPANVRRDPGLGTEPKRHEVAGLLVLAVAALLGLALASYDAAGGPDWAGPVGARVAEALVALLGSATVLLPWYLVVLSVRLFQRTANPLRLGRAAGTLAIVCVVATGLHLGLGDRTLLGGLPAGGLLGSTVAETLRASIGTAGAHTVVLTALLVALVVRTRLSMVSLASGARSVGYRSGSAVRESASRAARAWREARDAEALRVRTGPEPAAAPEDLVEDALQPVLAAPPAPLDGDASDVFPMFAGVSSHGAGLYATLGTTGDGDIVAVPAPRKRLGRRRPDTEETPVEVPAVDVSVPAATPVDDPVPLPPRLSRGRTRRQDAQERSADVIVAEASAEPVDSLPKGNSPAPEETPAVAEPLTIVSHDKAIARAMREVPSSAPREAPAKMVTVPMELPGIELLTAPPPSRAGFDEAQLRQTAERLIKTLSDYTIEGRVMEVHPGPVVTTYEVLPAAGTKVSKIARLGDDIAMSLEASKVRIVAPIPGKGRVGFEIPNAQRQTVYFRELVETEAFRSLGGALPVALGKDVVGAPYFTDLATMPHLIVAGATGAGKSVGLNVMLASLLYKRTPEDVRLLMVDPKMVELAVYDGIPHMLLPVVTDMKKASLALRWVVDEMERRYSLFAQTGSRNITTYNERLAKAFAEGRTLAGTDGPVRTKVTGTTTTDAETGGSRVKPVRLPYILCVVDEFADLIMVAGKDIEAAVARLAQKARAAGIHVILATQRPSVDVITGMIKANFPARVAFKVSQKVDSRTILDQQGAEHLLGRGDMLILPPGSSDLRRVHCAFVSEDEVQRVTDHWRAQGRPTYDEDILRPREDDGEPADDGPAEIKVPQDKYEKAVQIVLTARKCSVSYVQRYLGIGYNVAARIVDKMEREGVVGPPKGPGKDREVLG